MKAVSRRGDDRDFYDWEGVNAEAGSYALWMLVWLSSHYPLRVVVISHGRRLNGGPHHRAAI